MASEAIPFADRNLIGTMPRWLVEAAFVALLLMVFVGLTPFQVRDPNDIGVGATHGSGDALRQVCYLAAFGLLALAALQKRALSSVLVVPPLLTLLLVWCFASASWSVVPDITIRRAGLELVVVVATILGVDAVGPARSLHLLRYVLVGVLIVNWISIPILPQAKHLPGETDPGLVGDWRGLYFHKNIAGSVCATTAIVELYYALFRKRWLDWALFAAAVGFAIFTRSKSSLGFLPMALLLGAAYGWGWRRDLDRLIVAVGALILVVAAAGFVVAHADKIARKLDNPQEFTGRSAVWQAELGFIADHPVLGAGYGTFAGTGKPSPLTPYVDDDWVERVSHGHNGYLQLMVTIGLIGFGIAMLGLVVQPACGFWRRYPRDDLAFKALLFTLFSFALLHNLLESDYLEGDGTTWVTLLMVIAMLRTMRKRPEEARPWQA